MNLDDVKEKIKSPANLRLKDIVTLLTKHNAIINIAKQTKPESVRICFEELGPTFIKIGQILSVRTDIVSDEFAEEFKKLQDNVKTDPFSEILQVIESELKLNIDEVFETIDEVPLASASIGQVYKAKLLSGENVVVKVQHPGIYEKMTLDIELLEKAMSLVKHTHVVSVVDPSSIIKELKKSLLQELDFLNELKNIELFYEKNNGFEGIMSPKAYSQFTTSKVLVMEHISSDKISNFIENVDLQIQEGHKEFIDLKKDLADTLVKNYMKQIFEDGFFHADPHPGNILIKMLTEEERIEVKSGKGIFYSYEILKKGQPFNIVYIDFGMMGTLDESLIKKLNNIIIALSEKNNEKIATSIASLCKKTKDYDKEKFVKDIGNLVEDYYEMSIQELEIPVIFSKISKICNMYGLQMPESIVFLFRGIGTIEGIIERLNPELSIMTAIKPYVKENFKKDLDIKSEFQAYAQALILASKSMPKIPPKALEIMEKTAAGNLTVGIEHKNLEGTIKSLEAIVNRLVVGMIIAALIVGSSLLVNYESDIVGFAISTVGVFGYFVAIILAVVVYIDSNRKERKKK